MQKEAIPVALLGEDLICQAKSGMGKTAVFVLTVLHNLDLSDSKKGVQAIVLTHTRELAFQINNEFTRLGKYFMALKIELLIGGVSVKKHKQRLSLNTPQVVVGTPGRILDLIQQKALVLQNLKFFILDECDQMLEQVDMRQNVQDIFYKTNHKKQVMMFSATLSEKARGICKKFMRNNIKEIFIDDQRKLTLHGLIQHYCLVKEEEKVKSLVNLLEKLKYNQTIIFCKKISRAQMLNTLLNDMNLKSITIHRRMDQEERINRYKEFKEGSKRIMIATNVLARGIDIEKVNLVINFDMAENADTYLHRVGRAGRFDTKGLAISFVTEDTEIEVLKEIQSKFVIEMTELPASIDAKLYANN